jgi:tetratricopeptide (TPR) repeat protein
MDAPQTSASSAPRRETEQDYWTPEERRADRERRIAWRVAAVLLIVAELTLVLFALLDRTRVSLWIQLIRLIVLLPLAVFMWLDRKWARDTLLVLTILGTVVAVGILGPSFLAPIAILVTITGALLLILLGRPRRWRTITGAALYSLILVPTLILFLISALMLNVRQVSPEGARKLVEANQLLDAGEFSKARNLFREVVEEDPNSVQGHFGLCQAYMQGRSFALALNSCNTAIELNPKYVDPRSYRTALLLQLRRYEEAEQSATETLALDERFSAYAMRAEARMKLGHAAGARADAEKALELATDAEQRASAQALLDKLP